jgi:hypothetical protein
MTVIGIILLLVGLLVIGIILSRQNHSPVVGTSIKPSRFLLMSPSPQVLIRHPGHPDHPANSISFQYARDHPQASIGRDLMMRSKLVLAGLIRDAAQRVPEMIARLESIGRSFAEYQILIVENDSRDQTRERLVAWKQRNPRVHILGCTDETLDCVLNLPATRDHEPWRHRIAKMAYLRNMYLDYIHQHLRHYDYLMVMDFDIRGHFDLDGLTDSFFHLATFPDIQALGANGIRWIVNHWAYYDPFAYLDLTDPPEWRTLDDKRSHDLTIFSRPAHSPRDPVYPIQSGFAGAAIYRLSSLGQSRYDYSRTGYACEHVYFNRGFKMYLNPAMIFEIREH